MLSPLTLLAISRYTCMLCEQPLATEHAYPLIEPGQLLSQTTDTGPHHPDCAKKRLDNILLKSTETAPDTPYMSAIWVIQSAPNAPSARIIRLHEEDEDSSLLHLFSPLRIDLRLSLSQHAYPRAKRMSLTTRPATYAEIQAWIEPAVQGAMMGASSEEISDVREQIARLHKHFPKRDTGSLPVPPPSSATTTDGNLSQP